MKCPRCLHESLADAVFCQECGRRLEGFDTTDLVEARALLKSLR